MTYVSIMLILFILMFILLSIYKGYLYFDTVFRYGFRQVRKLKYWYYLDDDLKKQIKIVHWVMIGLLVGVIALSVKYAYAGRFYIV